MANQIVQKIVSTAVEELNSLSTMTCSKIHHKNMKYTFKQHTIIYTVFRSSLCIRTYKYGIEVPEYRLLTGGGLPLKNGDTAEYFEGIDLTSMNNGQYLPCEPFSIFPFGIRGAVGVAAYVWKFPINFHVYYILSIILLNTRPKKTTEHQLYVAEHKVMKKNLIIWPQIDATHCTTISLTLASLTEPDGTRLNPCWRLGLTRPP